MNPQNSSPEIARSEYQQPVVIEKNTTIQAYSPETELNHHIARGDFHSVVRNEAFLQKPADVQLDLLDDAVQRKTSRVREDYYELLRGGAEYWSAAMAASCEIQYLHRTHLKITAAKYDYLPRVLPNRGGFKPY